MSKLTQRGKNTYKATSLHVQNKPQKQTALCTRRPWGWEQTISRTQEIMTLSNEQICHIHRQSVLQARVQTKMRDITPLRNYTRIYPGVLKLLCLDIP